MVAGLSLETSFLPCIAEGVRNVFRTTAVIPYRTPVCLFETL